MEDGRFALLHKTIMVTLPYEYNDDEANEALHEVLQAKLNFCLDRFLEMAREDNPDLALTIKE